MSASPRTESERTTLLQSAFRGPRAGLKHDVDAEQSRLAVWRAVAASPEDPEATVGRDAALQACLALIPGIVLAGTHLRGRSDARLLRRWQRTGLRPRAFATYRAAGALSLVGILVTGVLTLGVGLGVAYVMLKRQSERLRFHGRPGGGRKRRKRRR